MDKINKYLVVFSSILSFFFFSIFLYELIVASKLTSHASQIHVFRADNYFILYNLFLIIVILSIKRKRPFILLIGTFYFIVLTIRVVKYNNLIYNKCHTYGVDNRVINVGSQTIEMVEVIGNDSINDFYIGKYECTQEIWFEVMGTDGSEGVFWKGKSRPVDFVSWNEAKIFIAKLNDISQCNFRLPFEREWVYAANGGIHKTGYRYAGSNNPDEVAWTWENTWIPIYFKDSRRPRRVGLKKPNALGIYDLSGNVWEWCEDKKGDKRVIKGGSWYQSVEGADIDDEYFDYSDYKDRCNGFRLVLSK